MVLELVLIGVIGLLVGGLLGYKIARDRTPHGFFKIVPVEDADGYFSVNVHIIPDQNLLNEKQIILQRDPSQK